MQWQNTHTTPHHIGHHLLRADAWTPHTTSDGAGAFWERRSDGHAALARDTMLFYQRLSEEGVAAARGVGIISGWNWSHEPSQYDAYREDVPHLREATPEELADQNARTRQSFQSGVYWTSVIVDSPVYMRWLTEDVAARGGVLVHATVPSLASLHPHFDAVVNATGMGARELAGDADCHAYRGQVIRVYAPHVTEFVTASSHAFAWHSTYILPRPTSGVVTCGGTYQRDREFTGTDPEDGNAIWERCCGLVPGLADPRTVRIDEWSGLRPGRDGDVRIEAERRAVPGGDGHPAGSEGGAEGGGGQQQQLVVHAYGHGGCGHSLSWGTALQVAALLRDSMLIAGRSSTTGRVLLPFEGPAPVLAASIHILFPRLMKQQAEEEARRRGELERKALSV